MAFIPLTHKGPKEGGNYECDWSGGPLEAHFISDVGRKRQNNEDACLFCVPENPTIAQERGLLFAVADGMGGASAGEFASHLALTTFAEQHYSGSLGAIPGHLCRALGMANSRVFIEGVSNPEYQGMGTTLTGLLILGDCAYVVHVGDSRIYLARENTGLLQVTEDHSLVAEQVRSGVISEQEARNHSMKNLITRAVGIHENIEVDLLGFRLERGDTLLICSDGLNNMVEDREVDAALRMKTLKAAARVLVGRAIEAGGTDNVTVGLVRVVETLPRAVLQEGCDVIEIAPDGLLSRLKRLMS